MSDLPPKVMPSAGGVETISELLSCYICTDKLRDASLCPHCSKMGCYMCIKRWVTSNRANCPHCRAPLTESSLIRVPLFDDLRHELEQLPANPLEGSQKFKERLCSQHKEKVSIFCETCRLCVCHHCVLWGSSPHRGHTYVKLEVLLQKQTRNCEIQMKKLREHMKCVVNQVQSVERKMEAVKCSKLKVQREMRDTFDKMSERLEAQYDSKQQRLGNTRQTLKGQAVQITRVTRDLEAKISSGSISCLLNDNGELREDVLKKLQELQSTEIESIPSIGELLNEMVPSYSTGVFKINPYMYLKQQGEELYSKPLHMCGTVWKLKVYPNGHRDDTGVYLSAFLELTEGYDRTITYQYSIEMLYNCSNKHPSRNYKKEYVSGFADGESWGYRRFYELAKLEEDGFLRDNTVVLRFSVRALTHHQKCRDLSTHIRRLEHKVESLQKELKATKENAQPPPSSNVITAPAQNEVDPTNYPHSPSRRSNRHQHSSSEPAHPDNPRQREDRRRSHGHHSGRHEGEVRREEEQRHAQERRYHHERRREGARRRGERVYHNHLPVSMSQQHTARGGGSQHMSGGSPVKAYLSQQRHSDSRLMPLDQGQQIMYRSHARRESGELRQHRRRSADPALLQHHYDNNPISPPIYRHALAPPRGSTQPQEHLHFRHDSTSSGPDDAHFGEEFGSQTSLTASPARHAPTEQRPPPFEVGSGDEEAGCSQPHPWGDPLSHNDIQISITGDGMPHTVTAQPRAPTQHHLRPYHTQSQEQFVDEEEVGGGRIMATDTTLLGGPFSSQVPPYYDQYEDGHIMGPISTAKSDMPSHTSALSQPVLSSRRRLQSSVPDLSMLTVTGGSNLAHSRYLSQSVVEMPRQGHRGGDHMTGFRSSGGVPRITVSSHPASQSYHSYLNRMPSDPYLNSDGVHHPGLTRTMLARLKEEPEHSPATHHRRQSGGGATMTSSQTPRKGYREIRKRRTPSPKPQHPQDDSLEAGTSSPSHQQQSSSGSGSSLTPTNPPPNPSSSSTAPAVTSEAETPVAMATGSQFLGLAGKSSSNTSLSNLNLIW